MPTGIELKEGQTYLIRVTLTHSAYADGNMTRVVTCDDGQVVWVHRDALLPDRNFTMYIGGGDDDA